MLSYLKQLLSDIANIEKIIQMIKNWQLIVFSENKYLSLDEELTLRCLYIQQGLMSNGKLKIILAKELFEGTCWSK